MTIGFLTITGGVSGVVRDDGNDKVIDIFRRHRRGDHFHIPMEDGGELVISPDGFNYVSFKQLPSGRALNEEELREMANHRHYVIKMLEHHKDASPRLNHYHVPGDQLEHFLRELPHRPGRLLSIESFYPETIG